MELNKIKGLKSAFSSLKSFRFIAFIVVLVVSVSCTISYKFNGGNIDYTKTKSISIVDFANTAELVYAPLSQEFSEKLRDAYRKTTRLQLLKKGGDLHIEGEIVGYELTPMGIGLDSYAPQTKLTITINVRFTNNINPEDDFEKKYTAYHTFDSDNSLTAVQDELHKAIIDEVVDNIYNDTVAKW
ncbi:MAG: LptE family protein [Paludibacter sp.]|nr:LptE family protein [Paludibacter sp.]